MPVVSWRLFGYMVMTGPYGDDEDEEEIDPLADPVPVGV